MNLDNGYENIKLFDIFRFTPCFEIIEQYLLLPVDIFNLSCVSKDFKDLFEDNIYWQKSFKKFITDKKESINFKLTGESFESNLIRYNNCQLTIRLKGVIYNYFKKEPEPRDYFYRTYIRKESTCINPETKDMFNKCSDCHKWTLSENKCFICVEKIKIDNTKEINSLKKTYCCKKLFKCKNCNKTFHCNFCQGAEECIYCSKDLIQFDNNRYYFYTNVRYLKNNYESVISLNQLNSKEFNTVINKLSYFQMDNEQINTLLLLYKHIFFCKKICDDLETFLKYYPEYISELHQYLKYVFKKNICVCSNFDSKLKITTHVDKFKIEKENIFYDFLLSCYTGKNGFREFLLKDFYSEITYFIVKYSRFNYFSLGKEDFLVPNEINLKKILKTPENKKKSKGEIKRENKILKQQQKQNYNFKNKNNYSFRCKQNFR